MTTDLCPNCQHPRHLPGTECETRVHHGRNFHSCLCLARPGAALSCPPQMTCQGGTLGYSDVWYLQHGHSLMSDDGVISPEVLRPDPTRTAPAAAPVPPPADRATLEAVCICGHTRQQHFEDVCITEITGCNCGDYLEPQDAAEVIDRWRQAALQARAADRATLLREAIAAIEAERDATDVNVAVYPRYDAKERSALDSAIWVLRRLLNKPGPSRLAAEQPAQTQDTLPAWLYQRFAVIHGCPAWDQTDDSDRAYWEHHAQAVRRAVERGGFKPTAERPAVVEQPDTRSVTFSPDEGVHGRDPFYASDRIVAAEQPDTQTREA